MRKDLTQYAIGNFVDLCENNYREVVVKMITCIKTKDIDVSAMSIEVLATMICERRLDLNQKGIYRRKGDGSKLARKLSLSDNQTPESIGAAFRRIELRSYQNHSFGVWDTVGSSRYSSWVSI